ncbi:hypothetical protein C8R42DRAFT_729944 [Lentinula raphanica]|nr:hypothetical protein C8R42DRAFT_729944 [Lentinula raphanica]
MSRYLDVLAQLKDPSQQSSSSTPRNQTNLGVSPASDKKSSLSKYQALLSNASTATATDYSARPIASSPSSTIAPSGFEDFSTGIRQGIIRKLVEKSAAGSDSLEVLLEPDKDGKLMLFGDPRSRSKHTIRVLHTGSKLGDGISGLQAKLDGLSRDFPAPSVHATLEEVEGAIQVAEEDLQSIKAEGIKDEVNQVRDMVDLVHKTLRAWRNIYPDVSPVRIDNHESLFRQSHSQIHRTSGKAFIDPADGKNTPALISYCLALAVRIFENTARRGASLVLKMSKLFGMSLVTLGGDGLTLEQRATLSNIPESIRTVEKKFNLDVDFVPYAICPRCNHSYPPTYPDGPGTLPVYPKLCDERRVLKRKDAPNEQPVCGEPLLCYGKPIISFDYYSFFDWFGRFIALPGIEKYGERFCEEISSHREVPSTKRDATDGRFVHEFRGADGKLFISERGGEGRWLFVLSLDYFNVEGNRIRGRSFSTGLMAMSCLNLPLSMRNDPAFVYIPALYHCKDGHEPDSKNAETRHFLKPLVDEFLVGYTRGVRPYSTHESQKVQEDPYSRVFKFAISNGTMDSKAAKPANGLLDITSHIFCHRCNCWHAFHGGRTDCRNWVDIDDEYLRKGAQLWQDAEFSEDRKFDEDCFGTRASELWRLPYWKPSQQAVSEPMHTVYLNVVQRYCREILGLDNPNDKKKVHKMPKYTRCFYYPFEPPPALSSVSQSRGADSQEDRASLSSSIEHPPADEHRLSVLFWSHLPAEYNTTRLTRLESLKSDVIADVKAHEDVRRVLIDLSETAPKTITEQTLFLHRLSNRKWITLLYVCQNLAIFPDPNGPDALWRKTDFKNSDVKRKDMAAMLLDWRVNHVEVDEFMWPHFTPTSMPPPVAPWAGPPPSINFAASGSGACHVLPPEERRHKLNELSRSMNQRSAYRVGDIHRFLSQPLGDDHGHLRRLLDDATFDALMYVCVDLGRSPVAKCSKSVLIHELVTWRLAMPRTPLEPLKIDSPGLLRRLQQAVREVTTPSWLSKPPPDVGTPAAGTLKADHWRRLIEIHLPLAMLSLWNEQSPSAAGNAHLMVPALETTMHLTCAAILMSKLSLSVERREQFRNHLIQHIEGIKQHFGGFIFPSHHLSLHISDFMEEFSSVRHWWSMPFESLGGKLQRIRTNHKAGEKQSTIHHSYCKSSSYRQWLLRPDCPPLLRYCLKLLDKAYNYDSREDDDETDAELDEDEPLPDDSIPSSRSFHALPTPPEVIQVVGSADVECLTRTPAERGDYTIPRGIAPGNSYICFNPNGGTSDGRWVAGQIQHIFRKHKGGPLSFIVKRSLEVKLEQFSRFWDDGFEAKTVSDQFSDQLEIIPFSDVIVHSARWNISEHVVVVLSLSLS